MKIRLELFEPCTSITDAKTEEERKSLWEIDGSIQKKVYNTLIEVDYLPVYGMLINLATFKKEFGLTKEEVDTIDIIMKVEKLVMCSGYVGIDVVQA